MIYANATILGGETVIGKGSVIGGNAFVTTSRRRPGAQRAGIEPHADAARDVALPGVAAVLELSRGSMSGRVTGTAAYRIRAYAARRRPGMQLGGEEGRQRIGRYEVIKTIGKGAMGVVYKARDPLLDRVVAVKTIMSPQGQGRRVRSAFLERFQREAKAAAKMQHPAIVTIFDVGVDEESGAPFMVLEYLPGESLADRLDRVRFPLARCVQIALDLASRAVVRAPPAHRPPRRQAGERAARRRQPLEARRFRDRAHARLRSHAGRHLHGHAGLLAARGDPRGPLHAAGRRVRVGRGVLRAAVAGGSRTRAPTPRRRTATSCRATRRRRRATTPRSPSRSRR